MGLKGVVRKLLESQGYRVELIQPEPENIYNQDGLRSIHNHDFMNDARFQSAYTRGMLASEKDYTWHWRVHVGLWAASVAAKLPGDFIECGVNRGFLSSAIMHDLNWDEFDKTFWLLDTFAGIDPRFVSDEEKTSGILERNEGEFYVGGVDIVRKNFSEWKNVQIVVGAIPETLAQVACDQVAYLHLDMNCAPPEVAAFEYFWPKLVPGGVVLLDDYAYRGYESQKAAMDRCAMAVGVRILSLPTGQGLMIKP
ncbi:MAG: class I SAM-dependent methyltransferase [Fimbriimonadaceae bacterium]|nr:MAG: class I SAM-dependent methyltransferase [Fimbriimonadaceae bacterium]